MGEKTARSFQTVFCKEHLNIMSLFPVSLGGVSALSDNPTQSKYHSSEVTFAPCYHNLCHLIHYSTNSLSCLLDARQPLIPKGHVCKRLLVILSLQTSLGFSTASRIRRKEANSLDLFLMILNLYMMKEIRNASLQFVDLESTFRRYLHT